MSDTLIKELTEKAEKAGKAAEEIYDRAAGEKRDFTAEERESFDAAVKEGRTARETLAARKADAEALAELNAEAEQIAEQPGAKAVTHGRPTPGTPGEEFTKSTEYQAFLEGDVKATESTKVTGRIDGMKALASAGVLGAKALTTTTNANVGDVIVSGTAFGPSTAMQLFAVSPTNQEFLRIHTYTMTVNGAAVTAEGDPKPESTITGTSTPLTPDKLAHHANVTTEVFDQPDEVEFIINDDLVSGVGEASEAHAVAALVAATNVQTQAFDTDALTTLRKALTLLHNVSSMSNGVLMNPADAEALDLLTGSDGHFVGQSPFSPDLNRYVWTMPRAVSPQVAAGSAYAGDLSQVKVRPRKQIVIRTGTVNTQFVENELTIIAETRQFAYVTRGYKIVEADLTGV